MLEKYFKVIIYHDNREVVAEEYTESDAEKLLHRVYSFIDEHRRCGEFCVGRTEYEAIDDLIKSFTVSIEKAQEDISRCHELIEKLKNAI